MKPIERPFPRVTLEEVSRVYGRNFALHRVSMTFEAGTTTILLGENGAGKTTLLTILATLDTPTSGRVRYGDVDWRTFARRGRRNVGWVSHDSLLYQDLTGLENLVFYGRMYGVEDPHGVARRWLERVGLGDVGARRVGAYSRGMRQRLSVARALLHRPALVLLDEPLTGLDRGGRVELLDLFEEHRDAGAVLAMITHDLDLPGGFADRVAVLHRGKLTHHGDVHTADDLVDAYRAHGAQRKS